MGALVAREIVQSRIWLDPKAEREPPWNYKYTYPITVFEAVKEDMTDEAKTLKEILHWMQFEIQRRQPIIPGHPPNFLVTYAGMNGAVGRIQIAKNIPLDPNRQSHDRIPTEKAIGELIAKSGLVDADGEILGGMRWSSIIGRPKWFHELGDSEEGFVTQKVVTDRTNALQSLIDIHKISLDGDISIIRSKLDDHVDDKENPHCVTLEQLSAVAIEAFDAHVTDFENPHHVTKYQVGLGNADDTSDANKPVSIAAQEALDDIRTLLDNLNTELDELNFFVDARYDLVSGNLTLDHRNGTTVVLHLPLNGLISNITYSVTDKEFTLFRLSGDSFKISVADLFIRYLGSVGDHIEIKIDGNQQTGNQIIRAFIKPGSIRDVEIANDTITALKMAEDSIRTRNIVNSAVTREKISNGAVDTLKLADRAVTGAKLFTSPNPERVLAVRQADRDPVWTLINGLMIADNTITNNNLANNTVDTNKIANDAIKTSKIANYAITSPKIDDEQIINRHIKDNVITGNKIKHRQISSDHLKRNMYLEGAPAIEEYPKALDNSNLIAPTKWVWDRIKTIQINNDNIVDRVVNGPKLFSAPVNNRVLVVTHANTDPEWGRINRFMMDDDSVMTRSIVDNAVNKDKIGSLAIESRHLSRGAVQSHNIADDAVDTQRLFKSLEPNVVLGVGNAGENPRYIKINRAMLEDLIIGTRQIEDNSITLDKIVTNEEQHARVIGTNGANTSPRYMQITARMLADNSIDGRALFNSPVPDRVLAVGSSPNVDAAWMQVNRNMIQDRSVDTHHYIAKSIKEDHIDNKQITHGHIQDWTIRSNNIAPRAITGVELFSTQDQNTVLAVTDSGQDPAFVKVTSQMIEPQAIGRDQLFRSPHAHRVLGVTNPHTSPQYLMIDSNFIVDHSIIGTKLVRDIVLHGTPETTIRPNANASNRQIPDTRWVRDTVAQMINNFNPEILFDTINSNMIENRSIIGSKIMTHEQAPRVLGITAPGADVEFIRINEALIHDGAVTRNKIARDITLMGSPRVEIRPSPNASDGDGGGKLIPDCQWVLDRIASGGGTPGSGGPGTGGPLLPGSVLSEHIAHRNITADKLFTSVTKNRLLGVLNSNEDPQYVQANNDMIANRAIDGRTLFTSGTPNRVLAVVGEDTDPRYTQINHGMMGNLSVGIEQLRDDSVSTPKILNESVTREKLANEPLIDHHQLLTSSVVTSKIANLAIENDKIADSTIRGEKLVNNIVLPGNPSVPANTNYSARSLRNIIISPDAPSGGQNGDIWLRYV